jgi:outer membrane protein OmpA-like peptidoglycan-associated protein
MALAATLLGASSLQAQSRSQIEAAWRFGANIGLNYNLQALGYQHLDSGNIPNFFPFKAIDGGGIGPYIGLMAEYRSRGWWGAQLRASYDSRSASSTDNTIPGVEKKFDTRMTYLTIEPLLRLNPSFTGDLYATIGPLFGINLTGEYDYTPGTGETTTTGVQVSDLNSLTFGLSGGLGYDLTLGDRMSDTRWYLSPFLEGSWMLHQRGRSYFPLIDQDRFDDIWSTVSIRAGVALKFGIMPSIDRVELGESDLLNLALFAPDRYILSRKYEEYFPLVTSVFFDSTSSDIPSRYTRLGTSEASTFTENDLLDSAKVGKLDMTQRMAEQMNVYYNVMNIYGARLRANPGTTVTLIGSAPGRGDGATMARNVRDYLVNTFGIDSSRITIDDRDMPRVPSGSARTPTEDRPLTAEENRRVEFVTKPQDLGTPVRIRTVDNAPIENDLVLNINDDSKIRQWQIVITGEGKSQTYGPFTHASQRVDPRDIMSGLSNGRFTAEVIAVTNDGQRISQTKDFELVKKETPVKQAHRYSIIFGYGQDDPVRGYENFLRSTVAAQIDPGSKVYIIGHTDAIGDAAVNYSLSTKRANEVRDIIRSEATKLGRSASYEVVGYGEEESGSTFRNNIPEGRFYNRGVIIEVVPAD